jgi:hypothetical protein
MRAHKALARGIAHLQAHAHITHCTFDYQVGRPVPEVNKRDAIEGLGRILKAGLKPAILL